jgi:hypothetical protein
MKKFVRLYSVFSILLSIGFIFFAFEEMRKAPLPTACDVKNGHPGEVMAGLILIICGIIFLLYSLLTFRVYNRIIKRDQSEAAQ